MKYLIASKHTSAGIQPIGGVQSWNDTVQKVLVNAGHTVHQTEPSARAGIDDKYDWVLVSNARYFERLLSRSQRTVGVCHGIIPDEQPRRQMVTRQAYVSEETRDNWTPGVGFIVRQPIDLDFWKPARKRRADLVVRASYRAEDSLSREFAAYLGESYIHARNLSHKRLREIYSRARVVFASGRAALEAMACGAPVVLYDYRSEYMPPTLDDRELNHSVTTNYSGRGGIMHPTLIQIIHAFRRAEERGGQHFRQWVEQYHDAEKVVRELVPC